MIIQSTNTIKLESDTNEAGNMRRV